MLISVLLAVCLGYEQTRRIAALLMTLEPHLCVCVCVCVRLYVCTCVCAVRHSCGLVASRPCAQADTSEYVVCVYWAAYCMHLTSSHGWSLLLGINHGHLWQANPAEVIHGAAFMTFHSGTQLGPLA